MDVFFFIFMVFAIFVCCSLCGFCCRKKETGAIYSTPVVVTSETHQAPGSNYAVTVHQTTVSSTPYNNMQMPLPSGGSGGMPYPQNQTQPQPFSPYPSQGAAPYPPQVAAPYPPQGASPYPPQGSAPYPPQGASPYPPQGSAPYPPQDAAPYPPSGVAPISLNYPSQAMVHPPTYNEVMARAGLEKQEAYNPSYKGGN